MFVSIVFLNNKLNDYFFFFYVACGMTAITLREDPSINLRDPRWFNLNPYL